MSTAPMRKFVVRVASPQAGQSHNHKELQNKRCCPGPDSGDIHGVGVRTRPPNTSQTDHGSKYRSVNRVAPEAGPQNDPQYLRDPLTILRKTVTTNICQTRYMNTTYSYVLNNTANNEGGTTFARRTTVSTTRAPTIKNVSTQKDQSLQ
jgi:hypothetical protein